jgi:hypothetical protein
MSLRRRIVCTMSLVHDEYVTLIYAHWSHLSNAHD